MVPHSDGLFRKSELFRFFGELPAEVFEHGHRCGGVEVLDGLPRVLVFWVAFPLDEHLDSKGPRELPPDRAERFDLVVAKRFHCLAASSPLPMSSMH